MTNLFYTIGSLVIGVFFSMIGVIGIMIPWEPEIRTAVVQFIFENSISIVLFGFAFLVIGLSILCNLLLSFRKRHFTLRSGIKAVLVEEPILQEYLHNYWREAFPTHEIPSRLTVKKNRIHIYADLPYVPKAEQKDLMENIRHDITELLARMFGYRQTLTLSISFQREKNNHSP
jgi:hypothetical protein